MKDDRLYLIHIRECIARIEEYTREGRETFLADHKTQDAVIRNLQTMREYIKEALFFSENLRPDFQTGRLDVLVQEVVELAKQNKRKGKNIHYSLESRGDVLIEMDRVLIRRLLTNIIANAVSFIRPLGEIRLAARLDGRAVLVTVEDEGPGIPEDKLTAIFNRFYSERPPGEKFGTHSGLGLSISKQIVEAHRGRIWAENRRDANGAICGARFFIRLPAGS